MGTANPKLKPGFFNYLKKLVAKRNSVDSGSFGVRYKANPVLPTGFQYQKDVTGQLLPKTGSTYFTQNHLHKKSVNSGSEGVLRESVQMPNQKYTKNTPTVQTINDMDR